MRQNLKANEPPTKSQPTKMRIWFSIEYKLKAREEAE